MGTIIKLNDVDFSNPDLPRLGDYGLIPPVGAQVVTKVNGLNMLNDVNGSVLSFTTTASEALRPTYANGVINVPDPVSESTNSRVVNAFSTSGINCTTCFLYRPNTNRGFYLTYGVDSQNATGANVFYNGTAIQVIWNNGTTRSVVMHSSFPVGSWRVIATTVNETGIRSIFSVDSIVNVPFSNFGGPPPSLTTTRLVSLGLSSPTLGFQGQLAGFAAWNRAMDDDELRSIWRAFRSLAWTKGLAVG